MQSNKFILRFKKHQQYLYISVLLIAVFFIGSSLITPKITSVTENLIEDMIQGNLKSKENIVAFEFNHLNSYLVSSKKIMQDASSISLGKVKEKLLFFSDMAMFNQNITNSFVGLGKDNQYQILLSNYKDSTYYKNLTKYLKTNGTFKKELVIDTIIKTPNTVINRKIYIKKNADNTTVAFGYDVDLILFWKYFSEKYKGDGGYTVVTNKNAVCILHPEPKHIGTKLTRYFKNISVKKVLQSTTQINGYNISNSNNNLKDKATSEFLGLGVLRYFNAVEVDKTPFVIIVSFPIDIHLNQTVQDVQGYFSWISFLAFITFMLILTVSRYQLKKEYFENLKVVEEKEQLVNTNEKYQKENALLQLNQLKKKMNPHFLFNSLNSLHVLIDLNPDLSQQFVLKLADVYRYLLEDRDGNLISVKKEITFLEQYVFLQEIRFNNSLKVSIINNTADNKLHNKIPFLSLETLVENAIKHNEITKQNPLIIEVIIDQESIKVINNYSPRKNKESKSHHIGLNYLENTYQYYQINSFKTDIKEGKFICILPYITL
ncbi:sensor histidine kinase [Wenyingzhuangia sp. IMCC45467]